MARITDMQVLWARIDLGRGRGGSGATALDLYRVTAEDEAGCTGTGFTYSLGRGGEGVHALLEGLMRETVVGADPDVWDRLWREICRDTHRLGRGVVLPALSAVDIAVWDLRARAAGLPLHRFMGSHRDAVPIYGSARSTHAMSADEQVQGTKAYLAEGYEAVKLRVGARRPEEDVERVRAVRQAVGDGVRLMVDCNERLDLPSATWLARQLQELGVFWMEEPLLSDDISGHARLADATGMTLAVGEHLQGRFEFAAYLQQAAASVLQPDVPLTGGVTEWIRIAHVAEVHGAVLSPHFLPELHVHLAAATPNCTFVEHFPLLDDVLLETLPIQKGFASPPDRPGHGMLWDEDALDLRRER